MESPGPSLRVELRPWAAITLLFMAGCSQPIGEPGDAAPFPPRTNARDKPVFMVHGYDFLGAESSDPAAWQPLKQELRQAGWTAPLIAWGYYGCDQGFDAHANQHGGHGLHYESEAHFTNDCGTFVHTRDTPIEHLAYHWAWTVYDLHNKDGQCVDVVAHSMGGLIIRYALSQAGNDPDFPPQFCVEDAVTLGTPHAGSELAVLAGFLGFCPSSQCAALQPGSEFQAHLARVAPSPNGYGGTDWTLIGSEADAVVSVDSSWAMNAGHRVLYFAASSVSHTNHPNYLDEFAAAEALVGYQDAGGPWLVSDDAPFPLSWIDKSLVFETTNWVQGVEPPAPTALAVYPESRNIGLAPGQSIGFDGACSHDGDLGGATWQFHDANGWTTSESDTVQLYADPWTTSHTLRFPHEGTYTVRLTCITSLLASDSVDWTIHVDATYNEAPTASRTDPLTARVQGTVGHTYTFHAACDNSERDLDRAEWWSRSTGDWTKSSTDTVQLNVHPWTTSESYSASTLGTYEIEVRCFDEAGAMSSTAWTLTIVKAPGATRVSPRNASITVENGSSVYFEVACEDAAYDLDRAEWWVKTPTRDWFLYDTDTVQFHDDPWISYIQPTLTSVGDYDVRVDCIKEGGRVANVQWRVASV